MSDMQFNASTTRITLFQEMLQCCHNVQFWEYTTDLQLRTPLNAGNEMYAWFFRYSDAYRTLSEYLRQGQSAPVLLDNSVGLTWIADFAMENGNVAAVHVMGPFAMNPAVTVRIETLFARSKKPADIEEKLSPILRQIPFIPSTDLFQYAIMFHCALCGERITADEIRHPYVAPETDLFRDERIADDPARQNHNGIRQLDEGIWNAVATGDLQYKEIMNRAVLLSGGIRMSNAGSLRAQKDSIILFVGIFSRAAISGGLPAEISYDLCDYYVDSIEQCVSLSELIEASSRMLDDYVQQVHTYRQDSALSRPIRICCDYIRLHLSDDLSFRTLAGVCGYTEYYLSRKFQKEMGISLGSYILRARLDRASHLLTTTLAPVQDISDSLQFSSRSYFSTAFRHYKGMSPQAYRSCHESSQAIDGTSPSNRSGSQT